LAVSGIFVQFEQESEQDGDDEYENDELPVFHGVLLSVSVDPSEQ